MCEEDARDNDDIADVAPESNMVRSWSLLHLLYHNHCKMENYNMYAVGL